MLFYLLLVLSRITVHYDDHLTLKSAPNIIKLENSSITITERGTVLFKKHSIGNGLSNIPQLLSVDKDKLKTLYPCIESIKDKKIKLVNLETPLFGESILSEYLQDVFKNKKIHTQRRKTSIVTNDHVDTSKMAQPFMNINLDVDLIVSESLAMVGYLLHNTKQEAMNYCIINTRGFKSIVSYFKCIKTEGKWNINKEIGSVFDFGDKSFEKQIVSFVQDKIYEMMKKREEYERTKKVTFITDSELSIREYHFTGIKDDKTAEITMQCDIRKIVKAIKNNLLHDIRMPSIESINFYNSNNQICECIIKNINFIPEEFSKIFKDKKCINISLRGKGINQIVFVGEYHKMCEIVIKEEELKVKDQTGEEKLDLKSKEELKSEGVKSNEKLKDGDIKEEAVKEDVLNGDEFKGEKLKGENFKDDELKSEDLKSNEEQEGENKNPNKDNFDAESIKQGEEAMQNELVKGIEIFSSISPLLNGADFLSQSENFVCIDDKFINKIKNNIKLFENYKSLKNEFKQTSKFYKTEVPELPHINKELVDQYMKDRQNAKTLSDYIVLNDKLDLLIRTNKAKQQQISRRESGFEALGLLIENTFKEFKCLEETDKLAEVLKSTDEWYKKNLSDKSVLYDKVNDMVINLEVEAYMHKENKEKEAREKEEKAKEEKAKEEKAKEEKANEEKAKDVTPTSSISPEDATPTSSISKNDETKTTYEPDSTDKGIFEKYNASKCKHDGIPNVNDFNMDELLNDPIFEKYNKDGFDDKETIKKIKDLQDKLKSFDKSAPQENEDNKSGVTRDDL